MIVLVLNWVLQGLRINILQFYEHFTFFYHFRISGLKAIIVSDRDGVPLLRLSKDSKFPELGTKQNFLATFSVANEQSCKMMLGQNKSILLFFKSSVVSKSHK